MESPSTKKERTKQLLKQAKQYAKPDKISKECEAVYKSTQFGPGLVPKLEEFHYENGTTERILCLYGTIPIEYRQTTYNIPVEIWLPSAYPNAAVMPFVKPTAHMVIKPTQNVDANGKVTHSSIVAQQSLESALVVLQQVFSMDPPVYSRPLGSTASSTHTSPQQPASLQPAMPLPYDPRYAAMMSYNAQQQPQPYAQPYAQQPYLQQSYPANYQSSPTPGYLPMPAPYLPSMLRNIPPNGGSPSSNQSQASALSQPTHSSMNSLSPPAKPMLHSLSGNNLPAAYSAAPRPFPILPNGTTAITTTTSATLSGEQLQLLSLQSAAVEKVRRFTMETNANAALELDREREVYRKLVDTDQKVLQKGLQALRDEEEKTRRQMEMFQKQVSVLEKWLADVETRPLVDVDELVVYPVVVHRQLHELVAEDMALDDTLYWMSKGLHAGVVPLPSWLKLVRTLAQEQFMKRALILKIQKLLAAQA